MGIFKRFRASMSFSNFVVDETTPLNTGSAVYRPYSDDLFSPGYRPIVEDSHATTNQPRIKTEIPKTTPKSTSTTPKNEPSTSNGQVSELASKPSTSKASAKPKKDKNKKEDKKSKEKKPKESKAKEKDKKGKKDNASKPVASVTIDKAAVASVQARNNATSQAANSSTARSVAPEPPKPTIRNTVPSANNSGSVSPPPPYTVENITTQPKSRNPLAAQQASRIEETNSATNSGFSSSWDQVAAHRQNLHKELLTFKPKQNNIRNMKYQSDENDNDGSSKISFDLSANRSKKRGSYHSSLYNKQGNNEDSGSEADA